MYGQNVQIIVVHTTYIYIHICITILCNFITVISRYFKIQYIYIYICYNFKHHVQPRQISPCNDSTMVASLWGHHFTTDVVFPYPNTEIPLASFSCWPRSLLLQQFKFSGKRKWHIVTWSALNAINHWEIPMFANQTNSSFHNTVLHLGRPGGAEGGAAFTSAVQKLLPHFSWSPWFVTFRPYKLQHVYHFYHFLSFWDPW